MITLHPSSVVTNEKGYATLSCDATSIVNITFHWEKFTNDDTWGPLPSDAIAMNFFPDTILLVHIYGFVGIKLLRW